MGDQPVTRADFDDLAATIKAIANQMAALSTTTTAQITTLTARVDNLANDNNNNNNKRNINNRNNNNQNNNNQNNNNRNNRGGGPTPNISVRYVNNPSDDDSSFDEEEVVIDDGSERGNHQDYRVKADIPFFHGTMGVEEFLDWQIDVDRFFEVMDVPTDKQVKMVAIRLKSTTAVWWDRLVVQRRSQNKSPIRTWRKMKQLMLDRFLPEDYEQILYKMYIECV